ncbi:tyrosine-type recombinase/integrase [Vibrio anguillarum]|uniref:Integrase n=2 Tax=Vibrio anguillarum TaxID=55601 RepID=A0A7U6FS59_VIBAN|nr:tyrosine-type recombinase/integrase [Vibrio anguillarum]AZS26318.1 integrase [Vibrio anguillarum]MBF4374463.1 integrase [Vibrio anguillarum]
MNITPRKHSTIAAINEPLDFKLSSPTSKYIQSLRSPLSRVTMTSTLNRFARLCGYADHTGIEWNKIDADLIMRVINHLYENGIKTERLNTYIIAIKKSAAKAWNAGLLADRAFYEIKEIQGEKGYRVKRSRPLSATEARSLFCETSQSSDHFTIRDNAILALLIGCGLRRSELLSINLNSFYKKNDRWWLKIVGKGNKERRIPINTNHFNYVKKWLKIRMAFELPVEGDYLFLRLKKEGHLLRHGISAPSTIYRIVLNRCKGVLGDDVHASPHDMRRTMATLLYHNKVELDVIQDLLGHANISTTLKYIEKDEELLERAVDCVDF